MKLIETSAVGEPIRTAAWALIESSFPLCEQRPIKQHMLALQDPAFHADIIIEDDKFIGTLFYWIYDLKYCYVEYLATDPSLRGGGYGKLAMELLLDKGYVTILEIDPPIDEISIRRKGFYERLGFTMNPYKYTHPSYRSSTKPHKLKIMSYPATITPEEFARFHEYAMNHVLSYVER